MMAHQPKYRPLASSDFFPGGRAALPLVPGTVARGHVSTDTAFSMGVSGGREVTRFPFPVTLAVLKRGQERFNIDCAPCHDRTGSGHGMIVERGFPQPPTYHQDRLRRAPIGHFVNVIANGFGVMFAYNDRVAPRDRWAIAAYIRVLQLSQDGAIADIPPAERAHLLGHRP